MLARDVFKDDPGMVVGDLAVLADDLRQLFGEGFLDFFGAREHGNADKGHSVLLFTDAECGKNLAEKIFRRRFADNLPNGADGGLKFQRHAFLERVLRETPLWPARELLWRDGALPRAARSASHCASEALALFLCKASAVMTIFSRRSFSPSLVLADRLTIGARPFKRMELFADREALRQIAFVNHPKMRLGHAPARMTSSSSAANSSGAVKKADDKISSVQRPGGARSIPKRSTGSRVSLGGIPAVSVNITGMPFHVHTFFQRISRGSSNWRHNGSVFPL